MTSVASRNLFEVLAEEGEDFDVEQVSNDTKSKKTEKNNKAKKAPNANETTTTKPAADKSRARPQEARIKRDYPQRGGVKTISPRELAKEGFAPEEKRKERNPTRASNGFRGGRSVRGGRGREYDRHSGTGIRDTQKKVNQGWGQPTEWEEGSPAEETKTENNENPEVKVEEDNAAPVEPPKPEPVVKTLEEYLAERSQTAKSLSAQPTRKPNEGMDDSKWKDGVVLQKKEEDFYAGKAQSSKSSKVKKEKPVKMVVEIEQRFNSERGNRRGGFGGGERGDRRSGRGRNERRGPNDNRRQTSTINVQDEKAFPSLKSK
jgi:plasminogen activator inhibitor 1 RNA-binding protein